MTNGPAPTAPHGTVSAYKRHLRNGETPCPECKEAWATYHRDRRTTKKENTMKRITAIIATVMIIIIGLSTCSSGGGGETATPSLSEAFCKDLHSGLTPFQIYSGVSDKSSIEEFADDAYGFAAISCAGELKSNEGLRSFLTSWDINPDA